VLQFELLEVIEVDIPPKKGHSLAEQFISFMLDNYTDPKDPKRLQDSVKKLSFKVNGNAHAFHHILDFIERLPSLKEGSKAGDIRLVYDCPSPMDAEPLSQTVEHVLRSFDRGSVWTNQEGSVLADACVVDVIRQLYTQFALCRLIDENTPRDGRYLLIFDEKEVHHDGNQVYCQVARWVDNAWRSRQRARGTNIRSRISSSARLRS
jgi:hypothetical protein